MPRIFISYRRADSRKDAGRLYDRLVEAFGKENVFKDVDNIPIGSDFRGVLREAIAQCDILLALIGQNWLSIKDETGARRLDNPADFVRIEIETALERDTCIVIPVLVDNAAMLYADDLPLVLRELAFKNATVVRDDPDFHNDVTKLIRGMEARYPSGPTAAPRPTATPEFNVHDAIRRFYEQFDAKEWAEARATLAEIRTSGKASRVFNVDDHEHEVWAALEGEERDKEYDVLRLMVRRGKPEPVWAALQVFWETYPNHDPDDIAARVRPTPIITPVWQTGITPVLDILPPPFTWIDIPAGKVTIEKGGYLQQNSTINVAAFSIAKYPVTNAQFQVFIDTRDGYADHNWWDYSPDAQAWRAQNPKPKERAFAGDDHPRANVTWYEAVAFTRWLSAKTGESIRLLAEGEWQRAAQGDDNRAYPWGNEWDDSRCNNSVGSRSSGTKPVTHYEDKGNSPFGVADLAGNVLEWTATDWEAGVENAVGANRRVLRGGPWGNDRAVRFRAAYRVIWYPDVVYNLVGFRCARSYDY